ncbi:RluA family pseudouridine synthase [Candidatus Uhrbacteria bacterium]|nr:RluA family pseudouridine synthase [Candidatus Uhrbacteria bacterium]
MQIHQVTPEEQGLRPDMLLARLLSCSRTQAQDILKKQETSVNGKISRGSVKLGEGDEISFEAVVKNDPLAPENEVGTIKKVRKTKKTHPMPPILYEDDDIVALEKPAGILVHSITENADQATLVDALRLAYPSIKNVGDKPELRPGIVHRLDKMVSGVMLVAKTRAGFEALKEQFQARTILKEYQALTYGRLPKDSGTITFPIARGVEGRYVARPESQEGKDARTDYLVEARFKTATLVRAFPKTGRTNQIRLHFAAIGHPLVGDSLYGRKMKNIREIPLPRLFLHAEKITFKNLEGKTVAVESPLPEVLKQLLTTLPTK